MVSLLYAGLSAVMLCNSTCMGIESSGSKLYVPPPRSPQLPATMWPVGRVYTVHLAQTHTSLVGGRNRGVRLLVGR